jgi:hypothetical protein
MVVGGFACLPEVLAEFKAKMRSADVRSEWMDLVDAALRLD